MNSLQAMQMEIYPQTKDRRNCDELMTRYDHDSR